MNLRRLVGPFAAILVLAAAAASGVAQTPPGHINGSITHLAIVTPSIDETARQFQRVMGFAAPQTVENVLDGPSGPQVRVKLASFYMPNFRIELCEPISANGPYAEHLRKYGKSIQHIGMTVDGGVENIDDARADLVRKGGRWTLGAKGAPYAYVDFRQTLGLTLEVIRASLRGREPAPLVAEGAGVPPLGALRATHLGIAVEDVDKAAKLFAQVLNIATPQVRDDKNLQYPPDSRWDKSARLRRASVKQGEVGVELIASVGGSTPWSESVRLGKGPAAQHLSIDVGNRLDEVIRDLRMKGGTWVYGTPGGSCAYLDFMDTLGLMLELEGQSTSAPGHAKQSGC